MRRGFTIVELLIVVVVIAILATITIVAYNGIQQRAKSSAVAAAVASAGKKVSLYAVDNADSYPDEAIYQSALSLPASTAAATYDYYVSDDKKSYCISVTDTTKNPEMAYAITNKSTGAVQGRCIKSYALDPQLEASPRVQWSSQTPSGNTQGTQPNTGPGGESAFNVVTTASGVLRIAFRGGTVQPITSGDVYRMSYWLYSSVPISSVGIEVNYGNMWVFTPTEPVVVGWQRYSAITISTQSSPSFAQAQLLSQSGVPANANFKMTKAQITKGPNLYSYATPSTDSNWSWTSTPNASPSFGPAVMQ